MERRAILVCGSRDWNDANKIYEVLKTIDNNYYAIVQGGCKGADSIAAQLATSMQFEVRTYPAEWKMYGKYAGPKRNQQMIDSEPIAYAYVFHEDITSSKGSKDMVKRLEKHNIPYTIIN